MTSLVVGFDLDLTLIDPRSRVVETCAALAERTGRPVDGAAVAANLGPPLEQQLAPWFGSDEVEAAADFYRECYLACTAPIAAMPGAAEALAAVRAHGGRVVVVTAAREDIARARLTEIGLAQLVDEVVGSLWGAGKGTALRAFGASVYVGDHPLDVDAARAADAVAVLTGVDGRPAPDAGADARLRDLHALPGWLDQHLLGPRLAALDADLRTAGSLLVAFSGGADSAFLVAAAARALGPDRVEAATAASPSLAAGELDQAAAFCADLGVPHHVVATHEMDREGYRANAGDRCYFCKAELLDRLVPLASELGVAVVATGTNADDARAGFRPGIRAAAERQARTPLRDAGLTKAQVRLASRQWGLPTWDKPAAACLSSRIAYGVQISPARLARVDLAEQRLRAALAARGHEVRDLRVRDLGDRARVEVDRALVPAVTAEVLAAVDGFATVEVDPRGFRSGAMNELLPDPERWR